LDAYSERTGSRMAYRGISLGFPGNNAPRGRARNLFCPIYTLMPDHVHLIWMGMSENSDQRLATRFLRSQMRKFLLPHVWQHQPHDHVLREDQRTKKAFVRMCEYIAENPVRGELAERATDWVYTGSVIPGYPILSPFDLDFWEKFWTLHEVIIKHGAIGKVKSGRQASDDCCYIKPKMDVGSL